MQLSLKYEIIDQICILKFSSELNFVNVGELKKTIGFMYLSFREIRLKLELIVRDF
jgi:hypothetical protein